MYKLSSLAIWICTGEVPGAVLFTGRPAELGGRSSQWVRLQPPRTNGSWTQTGRKDSGKHEPLHYTYVHTHTLTITVHIH